MRMLLTVTPVALGVVLLPGLSPSGSGLVVSVTLVEASALLARGGEATALSVLVNWLNDPVDPGVSPYGLVLRIHENDLIVLVCGILVDPVRVEYPQIGTPASNTLLCSGLERPLVLKLVHTLVGGFAIGGTLWNWALATSTADTNSVDNISLLGLVSETAGLVWASWSAGTVDDIEIPQFPTPDTEQKSEDIRLLLLL